MDVEGGNLIAGGRSAAGNVVFRAFEPAVGRPGDVGFHEATASEVDRACRAALEAFQEFRRWPPRKIGELLRAIAAELEARAAGIIEAADRETGLGQEPRLEGELRRTTGQLRAFARWIEEGRHLECIIDHATGATPDVRRMLVPVGPVAVFEASNFPLAFGVAGGDTAAALAAGCPVVVKAHPVHPETSERCGRGVVAAVAALGGPVGIFSLLQGRSESVGRRLVLAPEIAAVAFTGSLTGGRALYDLAAGRPEPIPVYAEMGSINPVFITLEAVSRRGSEIARDLARSVSQGTGQFCTKPGLVFVPDDDAGRVFEADLAKALGHVEATPMLTPALAGAYRRRRSDLLALSGVEPLVLGEATDTRTKPSLLVTDADTLDSSPLLSEECFGPLTLVVRYLPGSLIHWAGRIPRALTATIHAEPSEWAAVASLQSALVARVGRIIWNGYPTGVAVVPAMHHGGPYPATTAPLHTSVGMTACRRFLRPVAFQDTPPEVLPEALRDDNPWGLWRLVDWECTADTGITLSSADAGGDSLRAWHE